METFWFVLLAVMLAGYVVLDGFDLGAGIISGMIAKTYDERRLVLRSIGPVWDGNEVWLLAAGGALFFAFPRAYASSFSGFYLSLMMVLWLLMLRGVGLEAPFPFQGSTLVVVLRFSLHPVESHCWRSFSASRSATSSGEFLSMRTGTSSSRCGRIF